MLEQIQKDIKIREDLEELEQLERFQFIGALATGWDVMKRLREGKREDVQKMLEGDISRKGQNLLSEEDLQLIQETVDGLTKEKKAMAFQIWISGFLNRNRYADLVHLK